MLIVMKAFNWHQTYQKNLKRSTSIPYRRETLTFKFAATCYLLKSAAEKKHIDKYLQ